MKFFIASLFLVHICLSATSQSEGHGKPITEIFSDFHYYMRGDSGENNGFSLNRALLGYNYQPTGNITATVIVNVGSPEDLSAGSKERRYTHFREASITWTGEKLTIAFGMTKTKSLIYQQQFYGKRYVADNFEAINGYSTVADLGVSADYIINDVFKIDLSLMNGEGYNNLHIDNSLKTSLGFNVTPSDKVLFRIYTDIDRPSGLWQQLFIAFAGYRNEAINIGGEVAYKTNFDNLHGHDSWGFSSTGSIKMSPRTEIFGRYDYTISKSAGDTDPAWEFSDDRQFALIGVQYTFNEYVRIALNYKGNYPYYTSFTESDAIFLNAHFRF